MNWYWGDGGRKTGVFCKLGLQLGRGDRGGKHSYRKKKKRRGLKIVE